MATRNLRRIALSSVLALACSDAIVGRDPVDAIEDSTLSAAVLAGSVSAGADVDVRFRNTGTTHYWFSSCSRTVERSVGDEWVRMPDELRVCTAEVYSLAPGGELVRRVDVPGDASGGEHRFVFGMMPDHPSARGVILRSTSFEVR